GQPVQVYRVLTDAASVGKAIGPAKRVLRPRIWASSIAAVIAVVAIGGIAVALWPGEAPCLTRTGQLPPEGESVAVLALDNLSGDPQQGPIVDGIADDLTTALSRIPGLFVIARNSSFAYKGRSCDLRRIAKELGVRHLIEGSMQRS